MYVYNTCLTNVIIILRRCLDNRELVYGCIFRFKCFTIQIHSVFVMSPRSICFYENLKEATYYVWMKIFTSPLRNCLEENQHD
jgi:hypothetical protein